MKKSSNITQKKIDSKNEISSPLAKMPTELLLKIFKHIESYDLLLHVGMVCKRWHVLAQDPILWQSRTLNDEDLMGDGLKLLALAPNLNKVILCDDYPREKLVRALLYGTKDLKSLSLYFQEGPLTVQQIKEILLAFSNLQHLDLQLPSASHDQALFSAFHRLTKLQSLRLTGFVSPVSELINAITMHCTYLHTLHLVDCLTFFRDEHLVALVSDGRLWKSLKLVTYFISEAAYTYFACFKELTQLALLKCKSLSDESFLQIAMLPCLKSLTISENCIVSANALKAGFQLQTMSSLHEIDMTVYRADDDVAMAIATNCSQLVRLKLAMCQLTDAGLQSIILHATSLEDLDLVCNIIQGLCLHLLATHLPNIRKLNLHLCYSIQVNLSEMVVFLPRLQIIDPFGFTIKGELVKPESFR